MYVGNLLLDILNILFYTNEMIQRKMVNRVLVALSLILSLSGCSSGGGVKSLGKSYELPMDLPKEYKERFEIKEIQTSLQTPFGARTPAAAEHPELSIKSKSKQKKKKLVATPVFRYPMRRPSYNPIWVGEQLHYSISYFGVSAGDFILEVLPYKEMSQRKVYHVRGTALTSSIFGLFYRLNDRVESFMDYEGLFSHRFHIVLDETKQERNSLELNDSEKGQTFFWNRWQHKVNGYTETKEFSPIQPFSQDSLSALYYVRTLPLTTGSTFSFPVISEGKTIEAVCTVLRREKMRTPLGRIDTIVIQPEMKYQGILKKNGDSFLWLSDDERRIPIRLEAKVRIGSVVANLRRIELGTPNENQVDSAFLPSPTTSPSPTHPMSSE